MKISLKEIVQACQSLLYESPDAESALKYIDSRIDRKIQKKNGFGFLPPQQKLNLLFNIFPINDLIESNIIYQDAIQDDSGKNVYMAPLQEHNLIMPYKDTYGNIIALVGRSCLTEEQRAEKRIAKYKNTSFRKSRHLFGLDSAKASIMELGHAYLVEGQFDTIMAHANNIHNVVALGTANMSMEQLILLLRYTKDIRLLLDNDQAGMDGRSRIIDKFGKFANITNAYIPQGFKDLDEFLVDNPGFHIASLRK